MADKHHDVSQFHLRRFLSRDCDADHDPWMWVKELTTGRLKRRSPRNLAWRRGAFDGRGGLSDEGRTLERFLAEDVEPPAARALQQTCESPHDFESVPSALGRYLAWAASRSFATQDLFEQWVVVSAQGTMAEPPPAGIETIQARFPSRGLELHHAVHGQARVDGPSSIQQLLTQGWRPLLSKTDRLELLHMMAWYFQVRHFSRLCWHLLVSPPDHSFVIGDRPVFWAVGDRVDLPPSHLRDARAVLFAPLSSSVALCARNPELSLGPVFPQRVNQLSARAARSWVAAADEQVLQHATSTTAE